MDRQEFMQQISALRQGKLRLEPQEENGLSRFASGMLYETREYITALECGYRRTTGELDRLAKMKVGAGRQTMGQLLANQWSKPAALGYAAAALRQSGMNPSQVVGVLELMEELMDEYPRAWAEESYLELQDDPGAGGRQSAVPTGDGETDSRDGIPAPYGAQKDRAEEPEC